MKLPIIDYFANGTRTIYTGMRDDFANGCMTWVSTSPREIKDYYELAELAISFKERVGDFVKDELKGRVLRTWLNVMGSQAPKSLQRYQRKSKQIPTSLINNYINKIGDSR